LAGDLLSGRWAPPKSSGSVAQTSRPDKAWPVKALLGRRPSPAAFFCFL
jgi:hypothetical protein